MSTYQHGIYGVQQATPVPTPTVSAAGIQGVVGTAPVNLLDDPAGAVGKPLLLNTLDEAKAKLGYSTERDKFTLMQAVHCSFELFGVAPVVAVNVLDPTKHTAEKTASGALEAGVATLPDQGILLDTLALTSQDGSTSYESGTDYTAAFDDDGNAVITRVSDSVKLTAAGTFKATYSILDPTKVTDADIIEGIALLDRAFPLLGYEPELLLAPGWSQNADVAAALIAEAQKICSVFKATALVDIDSAANATIAAAIAAKTAGGLGVRDAVPCYPKVMTTAGVTVWYSALAGALFQYTDAQNNSTPFVSPSNKAAQILATVLADGTQVMYTLDEANELNAEGIFTALNFQGWRSWGNNTGIYSQAAEDAGQTFDVKDRFISDKRAFDWQSNGFIKRYFDRVDSPIDYRTIQSFITDENQFYNAFVAAGYVAGMSIVYNQADNPIDQIMKGKIVFKQLMTPNLPMEVVEDDLQFDPSLLQAALTGGNNS